MSEEYKKSGVSLESGYEVVKRIKKHVARTNRKGVMGSIGAFGGLFSLAELDYKEPILVSGTDGVGTKLLIAQQLKKHHTIGIDLVAMCVNDVLTIGAVPLFFLDYIAMGRNNPEIVEQLVLGIADGCVLADCALIGGETAEMPDLYEGEHYDLAGFAVGVVEKSKMITGEDVSVNDYIIGLPSSGIHSNGYSLVRKLFLKDHDINLNEYHEELGSTWADSLLTPTKIYVKPILDLLKKVQVKAMAHITGGGFDENIPRVLKDNMGVVIDSGKIKKPPIFSLIEKFGTIDHREMYEIFNMGIGYVVIVSPECLEEALSILRLHEDAQVIGRIVAGTGVTII